MGQETINIIDVKSLEKSYKGQIEPVLNGLDLTVNKGDFYGILGPNGAGKTTLMNILCGLIPASKGNVRVVGENPQKFHDYTKITIGVVPQDIALYDKLTGRENLRFFGFAYNLSKSHIDQKIDEYTKRFGLSHAIDKLLGTYSGGMKRRLNLMAAILHEPPLLFLDEPTVGIDVQSRHTIVEFLKEFNEAGHTILYTSHHMKEAETLCNKVGIMDAGKLLAEGSPSQLMQTFEEKSLEDVFLKITGKQLRD